MRLLNQKKVKQDKGTQADEDRIAVLKVKRKKAEEEKKLADTINDWDIEKKKKWDEFCKWNQEIQSKKALLLLEIEGLEHKRDILEDNIKAYLGT